MILDRYEHLNSTPFSVSKPMREIKTKEVRAPNLEIKVRQITERSQEVLRAINSVYTLPEYYKKTSSILLIPDTKCEIDKLMKGVEVCNHTLLEL